LALEHLWTDGLSVLEVWFFDRFLYGFYLQIKVFAFKINRHLSRLRVKTKEVVLHGFYNWILLIFGLF
jgi:hypothetical protein